MCAVHVVNDSHAICGIRLLQCVLCSCFVFVFQICCFEVLYSQLWNVLHFFMSQMAVGFATFVGFATATDVSFGVFIINAKESSFSSFCPVSSNAFQAVTSADASFSQLRKGFRLKVMPTEEANGPENLHCVSIYCMFRVVVV